MTDSSWTTESHTTARLVAEARFTSSNPAVCRQAFHAARGRRRRRARPSRPPASTMAAAVRPLPQRARSRAPRPCSSKTTPCGATSATRRRRRGPRTGGRRPCAPGPVWATPRRRAKASVQDEGDGRRSRDLDPESLRFRHVSLRRAVVKPPTDYTLPTKAVFLKWGPQYDKRRH